MKRGKIALVLTGGGAKGAFQAGVMKELFKKIIPDVFIGTSIGAFNSAIILGSEDLEKNAEKLEKYWMNIRKKDFFPFGIKTILSFITKKHLYHLNVFKKIIKKRLRNDSFNSLSKPLYILTARAEDKKPVYFSEGPVIKPVLASLSLHPLYPPIKINKEYYIDGGYSGEIGIKKAEEIGCDVIIIINLAPYSTITDIENRGMDIFSKIINIKEASSAFPIILEALYSKRIEKEIKNIRKSKIIEIKIDEKFSFMDLNFNHLPEMIKNGEEKTEKILNSKRVKRILSI